MRKLLAFSIFPILACSMQAQTSHTVCAGTVVTFSMTNSGNLSMPSYSLAPQGLTSPNGVWTLTINASETFTMYATGTATNGTQMTNQEIITYSAKAIPQLSTVQSPQNFTVGCGSHSIASIDITPALPSFVPVLYTITPVGHTPVNTTWWQASPNFTVDQPGPHIAMASYSGSPVCADSVFFSITVNKVIPEIDSITPAEPRLPCAGDFLVAMVNLYPPRNTFVQPGGVNWSFPPIMLGDGTFTFTVYDDKTECTRDTVITVLLPFPPPALAAQNQYNLCNSPTIALTATVGANVASVIWKQVYTFPEKIIGSGTVCVVSESGAYKVMVTDSLGCENGVLIFVHECAGISELNHGQVLVWPNPVSDVLHLAHKTNVISKVRIYDATMKLVIEIPVLKDETIDIRLLPDGVYFLITEDGYAPILKRTD